MIRALSATPHFVPMRLRRPCRYGIVTKNPASTIEHDVSELKDVIAAACSMAAESEAAASVFAFWRRLYDAAPARFAALPALLRGFGPSLIERALGVSVASRPPARDH